MSTNPDRFRPRDSARSQHYLDATIRTASPARLRLMMIERAVEVAATVASGWRSGETSGSCEHSLRLLDLLTELLSGVTKGATDKETEVCRKVADLYVFLVQLVIAAEENSDPSSIDEIRMILEIEAETWRAVCAREASTVALTAHLPRASETACTSVNFEA